MKEFLEKLQKLSFFQRIFQWRSFLNQILTANQEYTDLEIKLNDLKTTEEQQSRKLDNLKIEKLSMEKFVTEKDTLISQKNLEITKTKERLDFLMEKNKELLQKNTELETHEKKRQATTEEKYAKLDQSTRSWEERKKQLEEQKLIEQKNRHKQEKIQWQQHETHVENLMRTLCKKNLISYIQDYPLKGTPDNAISICDEYIIFDAKSPKGEDKSHFPTYIKEQAKNLQKYIDPKVKRDFFLVVPQNTINLFKEKVFDFGEHRAFIITEESIEPVLLNLKKIEEYDIAEKLSPEDRDSICRSLGSMANNIKRRIQIDQFFTEEGIKVLMNCNNLPEEIKDGAVNYETNTLLNPPIQRRKKQLTLKELEKTKISMKKQAQIQNIDTEADFSMIKDVPITK